MSLHPTISTDRGTRALFALLELSKALGSEIDLDSVLRVIVENASSVVDAERTSIFVYEPDRQRLWSRVAQGLDSETIEIALGSGIAGHVARSRSLLNIADAYADPRFNPSVDQRTGFYTRSIICSPVLGSDGTLLGVIQSVNKTSGEPFNDTDESLMQAIASHAGVALERAQLTEIHLQKQRLEQAMMLATEIQIRMLPPKSASGDQFALAAELRPAKDVGGDLYDYFVNGDRLFFCIGDVSGKGAGAALIMAVTKTLFRANAVLLDDPAAVLAAMSARIYEETSSAMFVTAFCGWLDLRDGRLRYVSGGHERALLLPAGGGEARVLEAAPGLALGISPSYVYRAAEAHLEPGQALFLLTDGVTDATNPGIRMFGWKRLTETLATCGEPAPAVVLRAVLKAVDSFASGAPQADDITMMCIRYMGV